MTDRAVIVLRTQADRDKAARWIAGIPQYSRVTFQGPKRTGEQNDKLHAMIRDVAQQVTHAGLKLSEGDWKTLFSDALKRENTRMVPNLDSTAMLTLSKPTSEMSVKEVGELILLIQAFGDSNGVKFKSDAGLDLNRPLGR